MKTLKYFQKDPSNQILICFVSIHNNRYALKCALNQLGLKCTLSYLFFRACIQNVSVQYTNNSAFSKENHAPGTRLIPLIIIISYKSKPTNPPVGWVFLSHFFLSTSHQVLSHSEIISANLSLLKKHVLFWILCVHEEKLI